MKKYRLIKELFPIGTVLECDPQLEKSTKYGPLYEVVVGIHKDYTITLLIDSETVENNPDYFELIENE
jgi:hypothetical protein